MLKAKLLLFSASHCLIHQSNTHLSSFAKQDLLKHDSYDKDDGKRLQMLLNSIDAAH